LRHLLPQQFSYERLLCFFGGLLLLYVALASPLDAFSSFLLTAHMIQHLLLMMAIPALLLLGQPLMPMLRGLPRTVVKEGLGPFLRWRALQKLGAFLVAPATTWLVFNIGAIAWHVPPLYELALRSPGWHDVEHATFFWTGLLFWWPIVQPWPSRPRWARWTIIPYLLTADVVNTAISATFVFADKVLYPTYAAAPFGGLSPQNDQSTAGVIMWVPGSLFYLIPAVVIAMQFLGGEQHHVRPHPPSKFVKDPLVQIQLAPPRRHLLGDLLRVPVLGRFLAWRYARPAMQLLMFVAAIGVIVDGLRGPGMAPMNLAGVLPWIHWRGLVVLALLAAGNLFCLACPFMLPRAVARRWFRPERRWPVLFRSKWLAVGLFAIYLWAYEAFSLWDKPGVTAWIIIGYFMAALLIDSSFRGASFCKYVCPIGQFNFINSLVSPYEIKIRDTNVCQSCSTFDCIRGNERQRGCELYLFQPKKVSNLDCTFCLDCVHACPHDNIGLLPTRPAKAIESNSYLSSLGRLANRTDVAALALVIVFGAFVNAFAMTGAFAEIANALTNTMPRSATVLLVFATGILLPLAFLSACAMLSRKWTQHNFTARQLATSFSLALVPLGAAMWAAHLTYHLSTSLASAVPVFQRVLYELSLRTVPPDWSLSAHPLFTGSVAPLQFILLDAGLLLTLFSCWRLSQARVAKSAHALSIFLPWGTVAAALYIVGVWILLQPMQMRGMMMMS
jgi:cytochrome c oxidase assembly factor CtaG/ferredoxin